jgi:preprotein translocase subunit SecF
MHAGDMSARVWFTIAVLAVFAAAIVYTAICARMAVAAESAADEIVAADRVRQFDAPQREPEAAHAVPQAA